MYRIFRKGCKNGHLLDLLKTMCSLIWILPILMLHRAYIEVTHSRRKNVFLDVVFCFFVHYNVWIIFVSFGCTP